MAELEELVRKLEEEKLSLAESLELFERGIALCRECGSKLRDMELRVISLIEETLDESEVE